MRKLALFAALGATLLLSSGCARWTLRPLNAQRESDATKMPEKFGELTSLMQSQASPTTAGGPPAADATQDPTAQRVPLVGLDKLPRELAVARLSERQGDANQARQIYLEFIAKQPQNPLPYHRLGVMAARTANLDEADAYFSKAMQVAPPSVELLSDVGYLCYLQSRFDEAERLLLQALEQSPENASATNNLALVYGARGDFDKSLRYFRRVNEDAKSHANVAYAMTQRGLLEDARNEYLHALTIDKTLRTAAHALAQIETTRKAAEQAAKRNNKMRGTPPQRDGVIQLSSNDGPVRQPQPSPTPQMPSTSASFQPVAQSNYATGGVSPTSYQPNARALPSTAPIAAPRSAPIDAVADRLMPLPALPAEEAPWASSPTQTIAQPAERAAFEPVREAARQPQQFSRFSLPTAPAQAQAEPVIDNALSVSAVPEIFAQARQVRWDADVAATAGSVAEQRFSTIPIATTAPHGAMLFGKTATTASPGQGTGISDRPLLAVEPVKAPAPAVRQAVHLGLSDEAMPQAKPVATSQPVKTQFSDFGTAPARLGSTATAAPFAAQR